MHHFIMCFSMLQWRNYLDKVYLKYIFFVLLLIILLSAVVSQYWQKRTLSSTWDNLFECIKSDKWGYFLLQYYTILACNCKDITWALYSIFFIRAEKLTAGSQYVLKHKFFQKINSQVHSCNCNCKILTGIPLSETLISSGARQSNPQIHTYADAHIQYSYTNIGTCPMCRWIIRHAHSYQQNYL